MAAELKKKYGAETELVPGHRGVFDVSLDGKLLFSKYKEDRFPEPREIFQEVDAAG